MSQIILDAGSGNTCRNDWDYAKRMIDELKAIDTGKHEVVIKWQIFKQAGENIPLDHEIFELAYAYAKNLGYQTTASVFDKESLEFSLQFDIPFIKIANNRKLDWLIGEIPRNIPVFMSYGNDIEIIRRRDYNIKYLCCVSKYPTEKESYEKIFQPLCLHNAISDHTANFDLWHEYEPKIVEWHYGLSDSTGLDAGPFMRTPTMLSEVL